MYHVNAYYDVIDVFITIFNILEMCAFFYDIYHKWRHNVQ